MADPRISPRLMWPLQYLHDVHGLELVDSPLNQLHGDVLRVELARGDERLRVTSVPSTGQLFLMRDERLLGVYGSFPELVDGIADALPCPA